MPTVQIPIGNQMVNVDVQDFASETTLRVLAENSVASLSILRQIASEDPSDDAQMERLNRGIVDLNATIREGNRNMATEMTMRIMASSSEASLAILRKLAGEDSGDDAQMNQLNRNIVEMINSTRERDRLAATEPTLRSIRDSSTSTLAILSRIANEDAGDDAQSQRMTQILSELINVIRESDIRQSNDNSRIVNAIENLSLRGGDSSNSSVQLEILNQRISELIRSSVSGDRVDNSANQNILNEIRKLINEEITNNSYNSIITQRLSDLISATRGGVGNNNSDLLNQRLSELINVTRGTAEDGDSDLINRRLSELINVTRGDGIDLATEPTLRIVADASLTSVELLRKIASEDSGDDAQFNNLLSRISELIDQTRDGDRQQLGLLSRIFSGITGLSLRMSDMVGSVGEFGLKIQGMSTAELVHNMGSGISGVAGMIHPTLGNIMQSVSNGLTMLIGMFERLGASFNTVRRIGLGFGDELEKVRLNAVNSGMQLDAFAALLVQNGETIASLGRNTSQGAMEMARLSTVFYKMTSQFGNFGMGMTEINQLLLDEIEIRRITSSQGYALNQNFIQLGQAITDNVNRQEAMARLTGEDMRARMAAQVQGLTDSRVVAALQILDDETGSVTANFRTLNSALLRFDPTGMIRDALGQSLATGFDPAAFAPEMMAMLGPGIQGLLSEARNAMRTMNPDEFSNYFESNLQAQFEALRNNESQMQHLIMLSQSSNQNVAASAKAALDAVTRMQVFSEQRQAVESDSRLSAVENISKMVRDSINATRTSEYDNAAMMSAYMERFGAAVSFTMTDMGLNVAKQIEGIMGGNGVDKTTVNLLEATRNLLLGGEYAKEDGTITKLNMNELISLFSNLPAAFQSAMGWEVQNSQLNEQIRTNDLLTLILMATKEGTDAQIKILNDRLTSTGRGDKVYDPKEHNTLTPMQYFADLLNSY